MKSSTALRWLLMFVAVIVIDTGATMGLALGVISGEIFTAVVVVVILTAISIPVLLSYLLGRLEVHPFEPEAFPAAKRARTLAVRR